MKKNLLALLVASCLTLGGCSLFTPLGQMGKMGYEPTDPKDTEPTSGDPDSPTSETSESMFEFVYNSTYSGYDIFRYLGGGYSWNLQDVTIPSTHNGYSVVGVSADAFSNNEGIRSVSLPSTIRSIGDYAFKSCSNLETVSFSGYSLSYLGAYAFAYTNITSFVIPTVTEVQNYCFAYSSLSSVTIPYGVEKIMEGAFCNTNLETVTLPTTVNYIGSYAFEGCEYLRYVYVNGYITYLYGYAFNDCSYMLNIYFYQNSQAGSYWDSNWDAGLYSYQIHY